MFAAAGRFGVLAERALRRAAGIRDEAGGEFDRTGILVRRAGRPEIWWDADGLLVAGFESLAGTFWRAQELSLLRARRALLEPPVLDFGCGDGSFGAALLAEIEWGADVDPGALALAAGRGVYRRLVRSTAETIPLEPASVRSALANSVLEHVGPIDAVLAEVRRVLVRGGAFVFTVRVRQYERDLSRFFGRAESDRVNRQFVHRNLWEPGEWRARLERAGFRIAEERSYQPAEFTFLYWWLRACGRRALGRCIPNLDRRLWARFRRALLWHIRRSLAAKAGGNVLWVAR